MSGNRTIQAFDGRASGSTENRIRVFAAAALFATSLSHARPPSPFLGQTAEKNIMTAPTDLQEAKLQPPKPDHYRLPPLVQPNWRPRDLLAALEGNPREELAALLRTRYGVRHCLLLDRARSGMYLLIRAAGIDGEWIIPDRKSTRLDSSHIPLSRMPSSA